MYYHVPFFRLLLPCPFSVCTPLPSSPLGSNVCHDGIFVNPERLGGKGRNGTNGYSWNAASSVIKVLGWFLALPAAFMYCCACVLASLILWLWGLCSIFDWVYWRFTDGREGYWERERCSVMPGEERNEHWSMARKIAKARNYTKNNTDFEHFSVDPLLKIITGMDTEQLALNIERRAETERLHEYAISLLLRTKEVSIDLDSINAGLDVTTTTSP